MYSYIQPEHLLEELKSVYKGSDGVAGAGSSGGEAGSGGLRIVDCRDLSERESCGYIIDSIHFPANEMLYDSVKCGAFFADLVRLCQAERVLTVVFHCALSQVRGPKTAGRFAQFVQGGESGSGRAAAALPINILVLSGGYDRFASLYANSYKKLFVTTPFAMK